jgi:general stress protein YciG
MAKKRGFASMDAAKQREIASKGGRAAHEKGTAHQFTTEEARAAGRKGGQAAHFKGTAHKFTSEEARAAGRKGGRSVRGSPVTETETNSTPAPAPEQTSETPPPETTGQFTVNQVPPATNAGMYGHGTMPVIRTELTGPSV